jgi:Protein phosphatase 2C
MQSSGCARWRGRRSPGDPARAAVQIVSATSAGSDKPNEDFAVCGPDWAVLLDGATAPAGVDSGCIHDVPWLVRRLAVATARGLARTDAALADILAAAIADTCQAHAGTCDLANPDSPSSTVAIIRARGGRLDYLVLGDSPVALRRGGEILPVHDDRADRLPGGRPYPPGLVRRLRNKPGGFWVASTVPEAAYAALSGGASGVTDAVLATDGVTRLLDWYGHAWPDLFGVLGRPGGAAALIRRVREAEERRPPERGKRHDDATVIYVSLGR